MLGHLEHADLVRGAEAVFDRPEDAERLRPISFEGEDGIHHVLEHAGTGQLSILGDVSHKDQRETVGLGHLKQLRGYLADLRHRQVRNAGVAAPFLGKPGMGVLDRPLAPLDRHIHQRSSRTRVDRGKAATRP